MINFKIKPLVGKITDAIIFDLGGVLLNLDFKRSVDAFIKLGLNDVENEMSRLLYARPSGNSETLFHKYEKGLIGSEEFRDALRKLSSDYITDGDIDRAWTAMILDINEENVSLLEKLRGSCRLFLLSNTNAIHIESLPGSSGRKYSELTGFFEKVYYSHEIKMRKPDPEIFKYVIKDAGLTAEKSLFIDDSIHNIEAARAAGLNAYHHKANSSLDAVFDI